MAYKNFRKGKGDSREKGNRKKVNRNTENAKTKTGKLMFLLTEDYNILYAKDKIQEVIVFWAGNPHASKREIMSNVLGLSGDIIEEVCSGK